MRLKPPKLIRRLMPDLIWEIDDPDGVYLTFDDGPNRANTEKILDILEREHIRATFFLTGRNVGRYPDVVRRIYQSGHAIGVHSYSHDYKKLYSSPQAYIDELLKR